MCVCVCREERRGSVYVNVCVRVRACAVVTLIVLDVLINVKFTNDDDNKFVCTVVTLLASSSSNVPISAMLLLLMVQRCWWV